jgi:hypothetical protein
MNNIYKVCLRFYINEQIIQNNIKIIIIIILPLIFFIFENLCRLGLHSSMFFI